MKFISKEYKRIECKVLDILCVIGFALACGIVVLRIALEIFGLNYNFVNSITFPIISIFANLIILKLVQTVLAIKQIKLEKEHYISIGVVFTAVFVFYLIFLKQKNFMYYWDFDSYLVRQYDLESAFLCGIKNGIGSVLNSLSEDYTQFINVFTEFPFCLTDRTGDVYVLSQLFNIFIPILVLLSGLIIKMGELLSVEKKKLFYYLAFAATALFPMLHNAASFSQPDWLGIVFALAIIILTIDFRFEKNDYLLYISLFISTACLVVTRRWYLYFIVGYYVIYSLNVLINSISLMRSGNKKQGLNQIRNILVFGIISLVLVVLLFYKMIIHIISFNYADRYAFYNYGGISIELSAQFAVLGVMGIIILFGMIYSVVKKSGLSYVVSSILGWSITILLFTRIQNLGFHHHLMLVPYYIILILVGIASVLKIKKEKLYRTALVVCVAVIALQPFFSFSRCSVYYTKIYSVLTAPQADKDKVLEVSEWVENNCGDEKVYMIPHSIKYNPDLFKNVKLPDKSLYDNIEFGFDVFGTHKFPVEIFESKYVITADPFPNSGNEKGLSNKLNDIFLQIRDEKYKLLESFDMGDGVTFYAYERVVPVDEEEVSIYRDAFKEEDEKYPDLFSDVFNSYLEKKNF